MTALINTIKQNIEHIKERGNINTYPIDGSIFAQPFSRKHIFKVDINPKRPSITGRPNRIFPGDGMSYLSSRINLDLANMPIVTVIDMLKSSILDEMGCTTDAYVHKCNALEMTLELMSICRNRKRALRRHDINIDDLMDWAKMTSLNLCKQINHISATHQTS